MTTKADYALLAGASYFDTRDGVNRIPIPNGWNLISRIPSDPSSGFEASAFSNGTEIVISYSGTDPNNFGPLTPDGKTNWALNAGTWADQLLQAAEYYLQVKAANSANPDTTITLTGHSLGGGLAALVGVFFGEKAWTFDQAPFAQSALDVQNNNAADLRGRLAAKLNESGGRLYDDDALSKLTEYLTFRNDSTVSNFIPRSELVSTIRVQGEVLDGGILGLILGNGIGESVELLDHGPGGSGFELHSQALLAAFLQSRQSAASTDNPQQTLSEVTKKLTSLLQMFFDQRLFANGVATDKQNFLEHLVRHEAGVQGSFPADAMVTRFTSDLWKLARDGGLTMADGNPSNAALAFVSKTLMAFAMQMYYEDTANATNREKQLFTDVTGGIRFDMADVSAKFATAFQSGEKLNLADAKGFDLYFKNYLLQGNIFTAEEGGLILSMLPYMRDWYVQAGATGLSAADNLNRGAFMLGGNSGDALAGGIAADLLVGNAGDDTLDGGAGVDTLLGGAGDDTLVGGEGHDLLLGGAGNDTYQFTGNTGLDIIRDSDGGGRIIVAAGQPLSGGNKLADSAWISDDKKFTYALIEGNLLIRPSAESGASGILTVKGWTNGQLGITLSDTPAASPVTTTSFFGDFAKKKNTEGTQYVLGDDGNYVADGAQANAQDLITGTDGADLIRGLGGDDALLGRGGDDLIEGGEDNDVLMGGLGADTIQGGAGRDLIYGSSTGALQYPLDVNYQLIESVYAVLLAEGFNWRRSSPGADTDGFQQGKLSDTVVRDMQLNDAGNIIDAGAGEDVIFAGTGDDIVHGGDDRDDIWGMGGADLLFGDGGADRIYGDGHVNPEAVNYAEPETHGKDILFGGAGADLLIGQGNDDVLYGGDDDDMLFGDYRNPIEAPEGFRGNDYLDGGAGNDTLNGNEGDDILIGGKDADILAGGLGRDVYIFNKGDGKDTVYDNKNEGNVFRFGAGITKSDITLNRGSLMLNLGNGDEIHIEGFNSGDARGSVTISSFEFADGSALSGDELLDLGFDIDGGEGADSLLGTSVDDRIRGFGGDDTIFGLAGNDVLDGGMGSDELQGGDGDDVYAFALGSGHDTINDASGTNAIVFGEGISADSIAVSMVNGSLVLTTAGEDSVTINGVVAQYSFADGTVLSSEQIVAKLPPIEGPSDPVRITGTDGNDTLVGGAGVDYILGAGGDDSIAGEAGDDVLFGDAGNDTLHGGAGADALAAGEGNDLLYGDAGADRLWGQGGADSLHGGDGDDELTAGDGDDLLVGGRGDDLLVAGGTGAKTYQFDLGDGSDVLTFSIGPRHIQFGAGIAPADIRMFLSPANASKPYVRLQYSDDDAVTVQLGTGAGSLDYRFADGTLLTHASLSTTATQTGQAPYIVIGTAGNESLNAGNQAATLKGGAGNDQLVGSNLIDALQGDSGQDTLYGLGGNDVLEGGLGNDSLIGGAGSDTYVYSKGDGSDILTEVAGLTDVNVLRFSDLNAADVAYTREASGSLLIHVKGSLDTIEIEGWYGSSPTRLQQIAYADGSIVDGASFDNLAQSRIVAAADGAQLVGTPYGDIIIGSSGNDTIDGGSGDDSITGGAGADTYVLAWGMGLDTVVETAGDGNVLKLGSGLAFENLVFERQLADLYVHLPDSRSGVLLKDYYAGVGDGWLARTEDGTQESLASLIDEFNGRTLPVTADAVRDQWLAEGEVQYRRYYTDPEYGVGSHTDSVSFGEQTQTSDSRFIERLSEWEESSYESHDEWVTLQVPDTRYNVVDTEGRLVITDLREVMSNGEPTIYTYNPDEGFRIDWIGNFQLGAAAGTRTVTVRIPTSDAAHNVIVEGILAGGSNNAIGTEGFGFVDGGGGDDVIWTDRALGQDSSPGQFLDGNAGNDFLMGGLGRDMIIGGEGNDYLAGSQGADRYFLLADQSGVKIIDEAAKYWSVPGLFHYELPVATASNSGYQDYWSLLDTTALRHDDTVEFGAGITLDNLQIRRGHYFSPYAYDYYGPNSADQQFETVDFSWGVDSMARVLLRQADWGAHEGDGTGIELFRFADGSVYTLSEIEALVDDRNANTANLWSGDGVQSLTLEGIDTISFGFGISPQDITATRDGSDLLLTGASGTDQWRIAAWYANPANPDAISFRFADGSIVGGGDIEEVFGPPANPRGTEGNDTIIGGPSDDYIFAGAGDDVVDGGAGDDRLFGQAGSDSLRGNDGADFLVGADGNDTLNGGAGPDKLWGNAGDDVLNGGDGADELTAGDGSDTLVGGRGNDLLLSGGVGTKTYVFDLGDGNDTIMPAVGTRHIKFGPDILPGDIKMFFSPAGAPAQYVRIEYSVADGVVIRLGSGNGALEYEFADGTVMTHASLAATATQQNPALYVVLGTEGADNLNAGSKAALLVGGGGNDRLSGSALIDQLQGGSGNDLLYGNGGGDLLDGGAGADTLQGGTGSDTYLYAKGDGSDVITEEGVASDVNILRFFDLSASDVTYSRESGGSLLIHINGTGGSIEIRNWYNDASARLQQILYADGSSANLGALEGLEQTQLVGTAGADTLVGTSYDDVIAAGSGDDSIDGGTGDDQIAGGAGSDTYSLRRGMGLDTIEETNDGLNVLQLTTGLTFDQLVTLRQNDDLYVRFTEATDGVLLKDYFAGIDNWTVADATGVRKSMSEVIADHAGRPMPATVLELRDSWMISAKISMLQTYSESWEYNNYHYSYVTPYSVSVDYPGSRVIYGFADTTQASDAAEIYRASNSTSSSSTGDTATLTHTTQWPITRYSVTGGPGELLILQDYGNLDVNGEPTTVFMGGPGGAYSVDTQFITITETITVAVTSGNEVLEYIVAGPSDNFVNTWTLGAVDGGAGNDVILVDGGYGSMYPGQFLYGGAGNDVLLGGYGEDMLIGGEGDDYLAGGQGDDTYAILADQPGIKIIDEVAQAWSVPQVRPGLLSANDGSRYSVDTVTFGPGVAIADLQVRQGQYQSPYAYHYSNGWVPDSTVFDTLDFSWGQSQVVRVLLAQPADPNPENDGPGIEFFRFADGTVLTLAEIQALSPRNHIPTVQQPLQPQTSAEDQAWSFTVPADTFADEDEGDTLTYSATLGSGDPLPAWLSFDAATRAFSGTPANGDVGNLIIKVIAADAAGAAADSTFALSITNVNDAPLAMSSLPAEVADEDGYWSLAIPAATFSDPDIGDWLTLSAKLLNGDPLPDWLQFDGTTQTLHGTPRNEDVGQLSLEIAATDLAGAEASVVLNLTVRNTNDAPEVRSAIGTQLALEDAPFAFTVSSIIVDPDVGDTLTYSAGLANGAPLPSWLSFDAASKTFAGTPTNSEVGDLSIRLTATDEGGMSATAGFVLTVANTNDTPVPKAVADDVTVLEGADLRVVFPVGLFDDVDVGDSLSWAVTRADGAPLPNWLQFDGATRTLAGTPPNFDTGSFDLSVRVEDLAGASSSQRFNVLVVENPSITTVGTNGTDVLVGTDGADRLVGGAGVDILRGGAGGDLLVGGPGRDRLEGGTGGDIYRFGLGDGNDTAVESKSLAGDIDIVKLGAGIGMDMLWFRAQGQHLEISILGTSDSLTVHGWYIGAERQIEFIELADGRTLSASGVDQLVDAMPQSSKAGVVGVYDAALTSLAASLWT